MEITPFMRRGATGEPVTALHAALEQLGGHISEQERELATFGYSTTDAVHEFQLAHGLPPTGVVDAATGELLTQLTDTAAGAEQARGEISGSQVPMPGTGANAAGVAAAPDLFPFGAGGHVVNVALDRDSSLAIFEARSEIPGQLPQESGAYQALQHIARENLRNVLAAKPGEPDLREAVAALSIDLLKIGRFKDLADRLASAGGNLPQGTVEAAARRFVSLDAEGQAPVPFRADAPIRASEFLAPYVERGRSYVLAEQAGLAAPVVDALLTQVGDVRTLQGADLTQLAREGTLTTGQAQALRLTLGVSRMVDDDPGMIRTVMQAGITHVCELARRDASEWAPVVAEAEDPLPGGASASEYAAQLAARAGAFFPTEAMLDRLSRPLRQASPAVQQVTAALDALREVHDRNLGMELLALDFSPGSPDLDRIVVQDEGERRAVASTVPVLQRLRAITATADDAVQLLEAGYTSASAVTADGLEGLRAKTAIGKDEALQLMRRAHSQSQDTLASLGTAFDATYGRSGARSIQDVAADRASYLNELPGFAELFGSQASCECEEWESILGPCAYFVDLMRFAESSIVNEAGNPPGTPVPEDHVLHLKNRRPDLWKLEMSRDSAEVSVPAIGTVVTVLEQYLTRRVNAADPYERLAGAMPCSLRQPFQLPLERLQAYLGKLGSSRLAVTHACTEDVSAVTAAGLQLADGQLHLITEEMSQEECVLAYGKIDADLRAGRPVELASFLQAVGLTRQEMSDLASCGVVRAAAPRLETRLEKRDKDSVQPDVERLYGLTADGLDRISRLARLARQLSPWTIREAGIVVDSLGDALDAGTAEQIVQCKEAADRLGLGAEEACVLWANLPGDTPGARSLFDERFNPPGSERWQGDGPFQIAGPADLVRLSAGLDLSEQQLAELIAAMPADFPRPSGAGWELSRHDLSMLLRHALLSRLLKLTTAELFTLISLPSSSEAVADPYGLVALLQFHDLWRSTALPLADLVRLQPRPVEAADRDLARAMIDAAGDAGSREFTSHLLTQAGLEASQIKKFLDGNTASLIVAPSAAGPRIRFSPRHTPWTPLTVPAGVDADRLAAALAPFQPATIARTVLAQQLNRRLEETDAAIHVQATRSSTMQDLAASDLEAIQNKVQGADLNKLIDAIPANLWAADASIPPLPPLDPDSQALVLRAWRSFLYALREMATWALATTLDYRPGDPAPVDLTAGDSELAKLVRKLNDQMGLLSLAAQADNGQAEPLAYLLRRLTPVLGVLADPLVTPAALRLSADHPRIFQVDDPGSVVEYASLLHALAAPTAPAADTIAAVHAALLALPEPGSPSSEAALADAADVAGITLSTARMLLGNLPSDVGPVAALRHMMDVARLARDLGVTGQALLDAAAAGPAGADGEYTRLTRAAQAVAAAASARHRDAAAWATEVAAIETGLVGRRRDALADYLIHSPEFTEFSELPDLHAHFLIDIETDPCVELPPLVLATTSLQRYVQRCIMGLERAKDGSVIAAVRADRRPEWAWRQKYTFWRAARTVYIYPHRYLDPAIRVSKSPLFAELESQLLQGNGDSDTITDAFASFLTGFDKLARLDIVTCYRDTETDTWHFIGASPAGPEDFHYRQAKGLNADIAGGVWLPWHKIDVPITSAAPALLVDRGRPELFWADIVTKPQSTVTGGTSEFQRYVHQLRPKYAMLRGDGSWTPARDLAIVGLYRDGVLDKLVKLAAADIYMYPILDENRMWPHQIRSDGKADAIDTYQLTNRGLCQPAVWSGGYGTALAWVWNNYPLGATGRNFVIATYSADLARSILRHRNLLETINVEKLYKLKADKKSNPTPRASLVNANGKTLTAYTRTPTNPWSYSVTPWTLVHPVALNIIDPRYPHPWQDLVSDIAVSDNALSVKTLGNTDIPGYWPTILSVGSEQVLVYANTAQSQVHLRNLTTAAGTELGVVLFESGLDGLMRQASTVSQPEASLLTPIPGALPATLAGPLAPVSGPMGPYLWELFLHAPFLLARHLTVQKRFDDAQRWYHYIFDPRNSQPWPFSPLAQTSESLRDALQNKTAIDAWRQDPFDPDAVARTRPVAYKKAIMLRYVENLICWADDLFTRYTPESLSQASLLYETASQLLGERPATLGPCAHTDPPRSYEDISSRINDALPFLIEYQAALETLQIGATLAPIAERARQDGISVLPPPVFDQQPPTGAAAGDGGGGWGLSRMTSRAMAQAGRALTSAMPDRADVDAARGPHLARELGIVDTLRRIDGEQYVQFGQDLWSHIAQSFAGAQDTSSQPVFFVPADDQLTALWDTVAKRLGNLRAGRDINGVRRIPAPYEPPIDPGLIIAQRAAGMSLSEALESALGGDIPPYRFAFMLQKAQAAAAAAAGLGSALQRALEAHDGEQLALLRLKHEINLVKLNRFIRKEEVTTAKAALDAATKEKTVAETRRDQYQALIDQGNTANENTETTAQLTGMAIEQGVPALVMLSGVVGLIPNLGSPFAMTFGGIQLSKQAKAGEQFLKSLSLISNMVATGAGLKARYDRRQQDWTHQRDLTIKQLDQLQKNIDTAQSRLTAAQQALEVHELTLTQSQDQLDFYGEKFSNLATYQWLADRLGLLYRETYNNALSLARLAANAYRFERADASSPVGSQPWNASHAGLLAAEGLQADLARMERHYLETDFRPLEVEQHFSLAQIDPQALVGLRATGACTFTIPGVYFDVAYPGQYQRRIKTVRLTMPCVTGPYTNVNATLTLGSGKIATSDGALTSGQQAVTTTIATSSGQRDAGLFELSFRDERYLPFEGAGAVDSEWTLRLPSAFRSFDYDTISDVILHISYTARYDPGLRATKEGQAQGAIDALRAWLTAADGQYPLVKVFSVRHDFPGQRAALAALQPGTSAEITFDLAAEHYPLLLQPLLGKLQVGAAWIALQTDPGAAVNVTLAKVNDNAVQDDDWTASGDLGGLSARPAPVSAATGSVTVTLTRAQPEQPEPAPAEIADLLLILPLGLPSPDGPP